MKIQYVAEDGKVFTTEQQCAKYERDVTFGSDPQFVSVVEAALCHLSYTCDRDNEVISFDGNHDHTKIAIAIATHFEDIRIAYVDMVNVEAQNKAAAKSKTVKAKK